MSTTPIHISQLQHANGVQVMPALPHQPPATVSTGETMSTALAAQAKARVEARFIMAARNPRDLDVVRQKLLKECQRPGFADAAIYSKPIGKDPETGEEIAIEDLSIRFAEAAIRCMTNVDVDIETLYDDVEKRIVRVTVTDLESTVTYSQTATITKTVERRFKKDTDIVLRERTNSQGKPVFVIVASDDQIMNKEGAIISKVLRNQGLRLVPGDIKEECKILCYKIMSDRAAKDPDTEKRRVFDAFATIGVSVESLKQYLGHNGESISPKELLELRGVYAAIKDGETTWQEVMRVRGKQASQDAQQPQPTTTPVQQSQPAATAAQPPQESIQPASDSDESSDDQDGRPTFEEIVSRINAANTEEALKQAIELIDEVRPVENQSGLRTMADNKLRRLRNRSQEKRQESQPDPQQRKSRSRIFE